MKKAELSSQVFIYILAAIVIAALMFVGYRGIAQILHSMNQVNIDQFIGEFDTTVKKVSRQYGTTQRYDFTLPDQIDEICFVDSMDEETGEFASLDLGTNPNVFIKNTIDSNEKNNVFALDGQTVLIKFYIPNLDVIEDGLDMLCLENKARLSVWLVGTGRRAELSLPP